MVVPVVAAKTTKTMTIRPMGMMAMIPKDKDYNPEANDEQRLGPDDYDVFDGPLEGPQPENTRKWLASMVKSMKYKSQHKDDDE